MLGALCCGSLKLSRRASFAILLQLHNFKTDGQRGAVEAESLSFLGFIPGEQSSTQRLFGDKFGYLGFYFFSSGNSPHHLSAFTFSSSTSLDVQLSLATCSGIDDPGLLLASYFVIAAPTGLLFVARAVTECY